MQVDFSLKNILTILSFIYPMIGEVRTWDIGTYEPLNETDIDIGVEQGKLTFKLHGKKLKGEFSMIRSNFRSSKRTNQWLLIKKRDEFADDKFIVKRILNYGSRKELRSSATSTTTGDKKRKRQTTATSPKRQTKKRS